MIEQALDADNFSEGSISEVDEVEYEDPSSEEYDSDADPEYLPSDALEDDEEDTDLEERAIVKPIKNIESDHQPEPPKKKTKIQKKPVNKAIVNSANKPSTSRQKKSTDNDAEQGLVIVPDSDTLIGKDDFVWTTTDKKDQGKTPARNIVHIRPGPVGNAREATTPMECFKTFFSEDILEKIIVHTNEEIAQKRMKYKKQTDGTLKDIDMDELQALLGLLILSAILKDNHLPTRDMFDSTLSGDRYRATMSEGRFSFLISCLRFDYKGTREERKKETKLAAISEIWEILIDNCKKNYKPSSYLTIDEQLVGFRGKCAFRMYIPSKPNRYGIKIIMLCDNSSKYMVNALPYLGKQIVPAKKPKADFFVEKLVNGTVSGSNRNITMDNWFISVPLALHLLEECHLTTVGTIKKNKRELPPEFKDPKYKSRGVGSSMFLFHEEITAVSYKAKKNKVVTLLSTMHQGSSINEKTKKPELIMTYNDTKGGVDSFDQMCNNANCGRKTKRWPLCFFYNMINVATINAFVVYNHNFYRKYGIDAKALSRQKFMIQLQEQLTRRFQLIRLPQPNLNKDLKQSIEKVLQLPKPIVEGVDQQGPRTYCKFCNWKKKRMTTTYCKCTKPICREHQHHTCPDCA